MSRLEEIHKTIRQAAEGNHTIRLETSGQNDELDRLTEAINYLLDHVQTCHFACEQTKEALREGQERYRRLESNIPGLVYTYQFVAGKHIFPYVNEGSRDLFGLEPEDLERDGSLLADLIHPDDKERRDASIIHSMKAMQPWRQELRHIVNGEVRWYDCMSRPERLPNGEILWNGIILEITDRKRAEEELREEESKYRSLHQEIQAMLSAIPDILCQLSPDLRLVWTNEAARDVGKEVLADVIGQYCYQLRHERSQPCEGCPVVRCFHSGRLETHEVSTNGRTWELYAVPLYGEKEEVRGAIEVARDVTERKWANKELQENEERLRLALKAANQGLYDLNVQTGEAEVTPEYATMLGYNPGEFHETNARWIDRLHPDDRDAVAAVYRAYINGETPEYSVEFRQRTKSGDYKWILSLGKIVAWDEQGRPLRMLGTHTDISEYKRVEEELREQESKHRSLYQEFQAILNAIPDGLSLISPDLKIVWGNETTTMGVYDLADMLGQPCYALRHNRSEPCEICPVLRCFRSGRLESHEVTAMGRIWELHAIPLYGDAGELRGAIEVARDVTERKQAEEVLKLTQFAMDHSPEAAFWIRPDGTFGYVNEEACRMLEYSREELLSRSIFDIDRDLTPENWGPYWERSKQQKTVTLETWQRTKSGRIFPVEVKAAYIETAEQEFFCTFVRDITERKQTEEALEKRLVALSKPLDDPEGINFDDLFNLKDIQRIQDLFAETTGVASVIMTPDGTPITEPSNFTRFCRDVVRQSERGLQKCMASDAILGRYNPEGITVQPCRSAGLWNAVASITVGGRHIMNWGIGQARDGTENEKRLRDFARSIEVDEEELLAAFYEVPIMSKAQFEKAAQALFVLANQLSNMAYQNVQQARFISERKQYEKKIRKLNLELEQRVAERTAQLKAANEGLEAFAYSVSHDLRAPLRSIYGFSQALWEDYQESLDEEGRDYLRRIRKNTRYMDLLIEDLLRLSRVNRAEMRSRPVNLSDLVLSLAEELTASEPERKAEFTVPREVVVQADPALMRIALENLLHNAWKFTRGREAAHIEFGLTDRDGEKVYFVKDNGAGFDMAYADKLFGVFQRLHDDLQFPGTGIGLATVQRIIHRHGGRLWAEGAVEQGATFYFTLPVFAQEREPEHGAKPGHFIG